MLIKFEKLSGCGNDFIIIDNTNNKINLSQKQIEKLCNRHYGIGADGLILIEKNNKDYFMNYYNADGTIAETCGNGLRCSADFIYRNLEITKDFNILTRAGLSEVGINANLITVSLNKPKYKDKNLMDSEVFNKTLKEGGTYSLVSMGNPHMVILDSPLDINELGLLYESSPIFKEGMNVNKVELINPNLVTVKTFERGVGRTLACGSGTCASCDVLNRLGLINNPVKVNLDGGQVEVEIKKDKILLTGPAQVCFRGEVEI